jgi:hypothetical protein
VLDVYFTVDVEIWSNRWTDVDENFAAYYRRYVYGPTARGDYALPFTLRLLKDHGLTGVFFVETLFAARFGAAPLAELLGLIRDAGQEVQLHAHTEWIDEARIPVLQDPGRKRRYFSNYTLDEQIQIIRAAKHWFQEAGGGSVAAFRAGSFSLDRNTLLAVKANGIPVDSSFDAAVSGHAARQIPGAPLLDEQVVDGVVEVPMTVFRDGMRRLRHAQIGACSAEELQQLLWQAAESGRQSFVLLTHNFETLGKHKNQPDDVVVDRTRKLLGFLDKHRDVFRLRGFADKVGAVESGRPAAALTTPVTLTAQRMLQQLQRWKY